MHRTLVVIYKWRESGGLQLSGIPDNDSLAKECADLTAFAEMTALRNRRIMFRVLLKELYCIVVAPVV
jgi:hypothetical protein